MHKYSLSDLKKINRTCAVSSYELQKWNKKLDIQKLQTFHQQQEIKKQTKLSERNNLLYMTTIQDIEHEAKYLTSKLEEQKNKYEHLETLVSNISAQIYQEKINKYEQLKNNKQPYQEEEENKKMLEVEKELKKILDRLNSSSFQVEKKIQQIRSLRSQRTVHSQLFKKLQKQFFEVQFYYKQLLIQRKLKENILLKLNQQFSQIYQSSTLKFDEVVQKVKISKQIQTNKTNMVGMRESPFINGLENHNFNEFGCNQLTYGASSFLKLAFRTKTKTEGTNKALFTQNKKSQQEISTLQYKKKLLQILHDFECESIKDFHEKEVKNVYSEQQIQKIFQQSNQIQQKISQQQQAIGRLNKEIYTKKNIREHNFSSKTLSLKKQVIQFQKQAKQTKQEILLFKQKFGGIFEHLQSFSDETSHIIKSFAIKQHLSISSDLTFIEKKEQLKQMMSTFNDVFLEKIINIPEVFFENSFLKTKRKMKNAYNFESKISKKSSNVNSDLRQTQSSEFNSFNIQTLLNQNNLKSGEKNQRNLGSILSQQQLIEQSIKAIRNSKKRNIFQIK